MTMLRLPFSGIADAVPSCTCRDVCGVSDGVPGGCAAAPAMHRQEARREGRRPVGDQDALPPDVDEGPPEKKYESRPVDTGLKTKDSKIRAILREGKFADPQVKADFDTFYTGYFLPRWSLQGDVTKLITVSPGFVEPFRTAIPERFTIISLAWCSIS